MGDLGLIPGSGRYLGQGNGCLPTAVFLPGEFHGQRSLMGYSPWSRKESDMIEGLTFSLLLLIELLFHARLYAGYFMNISTDSHDEPTHFIDRKTNEQRNLFSCPNTFV